MCGRAVLPAKRMRCAAIAGAALALAIVVAGRGAHAADLQVAPVSLHFADTEQSQPLWITNEGSEPVQVQVRVQQWTQPAGSDVLRPTRDVVASPATAAIAPGQKQLVRIVRPTPASAGVERSYRVLVDELPVAFDSAQPPAQGLRLLLRYSLPVFIAPRGAPAALASPADMRPLVARWSPGLPLRIENRGTRRVRISALVHQDAQGRRTPVVPGLLGYALPGSAMEWELPAARTLGPGTLRARLNDDALEQELPLAPDL